MSRFGWPRFLLVLATILALSAPASIALADDDKPDPGGTHVDDPPALYTYTVTRPAQTFDSNFGSQLGTVSGCDDCAQAVTLPFTFNFYGYSYTTAYVSSNGLINFGANDPSFGNSIAGLQGKIAIAPLWDDWDSRGIGAVFYRASSTAAVFTWKTQHFSYTSFGSNYVEFQAILYSDGRIQFNYRTNTHPSWTTATVGISTADTNVSTAYAVNVNANTNNMASYLFAPGGQANQPPTVTANSGSVVVNEGQPAANSGAYSDANAGDNVTVTASVGTITKTGTNSGTWSWSFNTTDGPAQSQPVTITANDGNGGTANTTFQLTVNNVASTATFNAPSSVNEGSPISLSLTGASDPSPVDTAAGFSYAFDCGSGYGAYGAASSASCPTTDNGTRTVKGKIRDKDGGETEYSSSVTINNVAPTVNAGADATLYSGQS
ncbi:MAG: hypothetical protein HY691_18930, partial [Chloroflexi bacterium]|nr:hypothetical protein [Chloroflexota bacterium]